MNSNGQFQQLKIWCSKKILIYCKKTVAVVAVSKYMYLFVIIVDPQNQEYGWIFTKITSLHANTEKTTQTQLLNPKYCIEKDLVNSVIFKMICLLKISKRLANRESM